MTNVNRLPRNIWVISDTHFSHINILKFRDDNKPGNPLIRPEFADTEEMNNGVDFFAILGKETRKGSNE